MKVSTSGFYAWRANPVSDRDLDDAVLDQHDRRHPPHEPALVWVAPGPRRASTRPGHPLLEKARRAPHAPGGHRRASIGARARAARGETHDAEPADDLVQAPFDPDGPDRLWVMDVTEHPTPEGKCYLAVVLDAWSRRVVGWSIADHIRSELVVDAAADGDLAPPAARGQTIAHSDHGSQYTSWAFGRRLRAAGLLGSMGTIGDCPLTGQCAIGSSSRPMNAVDTGDKRLYRSTAFPSCSRQARRALLMSHGHRAACRTRERSMATSQRAHV